MIPLDNLDYFRQLFLNVFLTLSGMSEQELNIHSAFILGYWLKGKMDGMALCRHYNWSLKLLWLNMFHNHATFFISSSFLLHSTSKTNIWWVSCGIMRNTTQCTEMLLYSSILWCCYHLFCSWWEICFAWNVAGKLMSIWKNLWNIRGIKCPPCIGDNFMSNFLINFACARLCIFFLTWIVQTCIRLDGCSAGHVIHSRKSFIPRKNLLCALILGLSKTLRCKPPNGQLAPKFPIFKME